MKESLGNQILARIGASATALILKLTPQASLPGSPHEHEEKLTHQAERSEASPHVLGYFLTCGLIVQHNKICFVLPVF